MSACRPRSAHRHPGPRALSHRQGARRLRGRRRGCVIVATDRISAFDYVLGLGHSRQGTHPHAAIGVLVRALAGRRPEPRHGARSVGCTRRRRSAHAERLRGRSMLVRRTTPVPIECVARGYLAGSAWKEYTRTGSVCGIALPPGLRESDRLPAPIFTPATKAESGHDENISSRERGGARSATDRSGVSGARDAGALRARRRRTPSRAASSSPTPSSSSGGPASRARAT